MNKRASSLISDITAGTKQAQAECKILDKNYYANDHSFAHAKFCAESYLSQFI